MPRSRTCASTTATPRARRARRRPSRQCFRPGPFRAPWRDELSNHGSGSYGVDLMLLRGPLLEDGAPDVDHLASLLDSLHGRVRLVAVSGASNVTGHVPDLALWSRLAHESGAELCVDAAQLAPHRALELAALGVDHCAFSGHKLFAPFGSGVLVSPVRFLESGPPDVW